VIDRWVYQRENFEGRIDDAVNECRLHDVNESP
jgi:hypothetical protein